MLTSITCIIELLTVQPHTPTPEPVKYDKTDGQWYTHDGVDVKGTQQRKGNGVQCMLQLYKAFITTIM